MNQTVTMIDDAEWRSANPATDDGGFGALSCKLGNFPLEAMDVRAHIVGLSYRVVLRQTFVNNLGAPLEATYIFPLPPRGAVTDFRLRIGDREVVGDIKERGEARASYDRALESGHRAAIAEEDRSGVFNMRVGNLIPGDRAEVELVISGPLELDGATASFRFPLVVAPRYIPGRGLEGQSVGAGIADDTDVLPDASRISPPVLLPGYPNPVRLGLRVELEDGGLSVSNLRSALHSVVSEAHRSRRVIELRPGERLNRDFLLRYEIASDELTTSLTASADADGRGGTFCLTLVPPKGAIDSSKPRDVVFVLDRSGSMGGWKMIAARRAVARMVDSLGGSDRFSILAFDNTIESCAHLGGGLSDATDRNRYRAIEFLAGLEARGGTEMYQPLLAAAKTLGSGYRDRERIMVLVTDGQVGNEDQILRDLSAQVGCRLFTVGIDRAVNEGFLRRLAALGAGSCSLVESEDRLEEAMDTLHRRISVPVISELAIAAGGFDIDTSSLVPRRLSDLFADAATTIRGRYRGSVTGQLRISGTDIAGERYHREIAATAKPSKAAASIWARGQIRQLEDEYAIGGRNKNELAAKVTKLSLTHKVLCRFTAFVAVENEVVANPGGRNIEVVQPVNLPDGWGEQQTFTGKVGSSKKQRARAQSMSHLSDLGTGSFAPMQAEGSGDGGNANVDASKLDPLAQGAPLDADEEAGDDFAEMMQEVETRSVPKPAPMANPGPGAPPAPRPSASPPPPAASPSSAGEALRRLRGVVPRRPKKKNKSERSSGRASSAPVFLPTPLIARLEEILERHDRRTWLDAAVRLARLLIEIDELLADLASTGVGSMPIGSIRRTRAAIEKARAEEIEALLRELITELAGSGAEPAASSRKQEPFWR